MIAGTPNSNIQQARLVELIKHLAPNEGYTQSILDDVTLMRSNRSLEITPALYEPSIVIVVQGRKRGFHGGKVYVYDANHYLVLSIPLPFIVETEASETEPMLGVALRIDQAAIAEIAVALDDENAQLDEPPVSLYASPIKPKLADVVLRLLEALAVPEEAKLLGPMIIREIFYRVLKGEQGAQLRASLQFGGHYGRIAQVLRFIHSNYASSLTVAMLADMAHMSVPAFHVHFKEVSQTSPNQYIKAIRLHNARLLMIRHGVNAVTAADTVGYQSASQFSREFKRLFGYTPKEEVRRLKNVLALTAQYDCSTTPS